MKIVTALQMKLIDHAAIASGISSQVLMQRAAKAVFQEIRSEFSPRFKLKTALVIVGKGKNGGDGRLVARLLKQAGLKTYIYDAFNEKFLKKDVKKLIAQADFIVDALFGTGLNAPVRFPQYKLIELINQCHKPVFSVDIPSGIDGSTGKVMGKAIEADTTVTFGCPKLGHFLPPGSDHTGHLIIRNIGFSKKMVSSVSEAPDLIEPSYFKEKIPRRKRSTHKGEAGHLLVIAGSPGKMGAAQLTVQAAFRSGVGLVTLLSDPRSLSSVTPQEAFLEALPRSEKGCQEKLSGKGAIVIGPGLGFSNQALRVLTSVLKWSRVPTVVDADALTWISRYPQLINMAQAPLVFTPHPGEMGRLIHLSPRKVQADRLGVAQSFVKHRPIFLILKGAGSIVVCPDCSTYINSTGHPAMATAGAGDVLSGILGSFLAQGMPVKEALLAGVYLHGWCGEAWVRREKANRGMMARDLISIIPRGLTELSK